MVGASSGDTGPLGQLDSEPRSSHVSRGRNARANAEAFMKATTIASALLAATTLLVADGAQARRAAHVGGSYYYYYGGWGWGAAEQAAVDAKAAARAAYDARDGDYLHRCYQPPRMWNGN